VTLDRGIEAQRSLTVLLRRHEGRFVDGIAVGGNQAFHLVEPVDVKTESGKVSGSVKVTLQPDGDFPPGGRVVECIYQLRADLSGDDEVVGTFSGSYGRRRSENGSLTGSILSTEQLRREFYGRADR
jgi:hypothetical protein